MMEMSVCSVISCEYWWIHFIQMMTRHQMALQWITWWFTRFFTKFDRYKPNIWICQNAINHLKSSSAHRCSHSIFHWDMAEFIKFWFEMPWKPLAERIQLLIRNYIFKLRWCFLNAIQCDIISDEIENHWKLSIFFTRLFVVQINTWIYFDSMSDVQSFSMQNRFVQFQIVAKTQAFPFQECKLKKKKKERFIDFISNIFQIIPSTFIRDFYFHSIEDRREIQIIVCFLSFEIDEFFFSSQLSRLYSK